MRPAAILVPFVGMFLLTLAVWVNMFVQRIKAINAAGVRPQTRADLDKYPPLAVNSSANFQNLFEIPVIFYACVLGVVATASVDTFHVVCAYGFFVFRILHSAIHCTYNDVNHRFGVYAVSALFVWVMVFRLAATVLAAS